MIFPKSNVMFARSSRKNDIIVLGSFVPTKRDPSTTLKTPKTKKTLALPLLYKASRRGEEAQ